MRKHLLFFVLMVVLTGLNGLNAAAQDAISKKPVYIHARVGETGVVTITIGESVPVRWNYVYDDYDDYDSYTPAKYELCRADAIDGEYVSVGAGETSGSTGQAEAVDQTAVIGNTYYYKARYYNDSTGTVVYGEFSDPLSITVVPSPNVVNYVRATDENTFTIDWTGTNNVDGYDIYMKEFENENLSSMHSFSTWLEDGIIYNDYELNDTVNNIPYTLIADVPASAIQYNYSGAKHGMGYIFAIRTYKMVGDTKVESSVMYAAHGVMDYYFCYNAENPKFDYKWPKSQKQARKLCKTISVKVWDFKNHAKHSGAKKSRTLYITVNKKYADTIKQIYKDLYNDKSKPPIYEAGSYRWRKEESTWSYHTVGTAIDMNTNENPMYKYTYKKNGKLKKKIIVGSFYKPKSNPYSFPRNGVVENTFAKYGFVRLENDLMHFNADYIYPSSNYDYSPKNY